MSSAFCWSSVVFPESRRRRIFINHPISRGLRSCRASLPTSFFGFFPFRRLVQLLARNRFQLRPTDHYPRAPRAFAALLLPLALLPLLLLLLLLLLLQAAAAAATAAAAVAAGFWLLAPGCWLQAPLLLLRPHVDPIATRQTRGT